MTRRMVAGTFTLCLAGLVACARSGPVCSCMPPLPPLPYVAPFSVTTGGASGSDVFLSIRRDYKNNFVLAGYTHSFGAGNADAWVVKLNASGNVLWQKTYGGANLDVANSIQFTSDGGYVLAGTTQSSGAGLADAWVVKLDATGNIQWQKTYGGALNDFGNSILNTSSGGYVLAGATQSSGAGNYDAWVIKLDSLGNVLWQKTLGGAGEDTALSIQNNSFHNGYVLVGNTSSFGAGSLDAWIIMLDDTGNVVWQKTYGGAEQDSASGIEYTYDSGYIMAGFTRSSGTGNFDAWIVKLDATGNVLWQKTIGGSDNDYAFSVLYDNGNSIVIAGSTYSAGAGSSDAWVVKLDTSGNVLWQKALGGMGADVARSIQATGYGYIVGGSSSSLGTLADDAWIINLDDSGNVPFNTTASGFGVQDSTALVTGSLVSPANSTATPANSSVAPVISGVTAADSVMTVERQTGLSGVLATPGNLIATSGGIGTIGLTWTDNANNESGYIVYVSSDNVSFSRLATLGVDATGYTHTLAGGETRYYRVEAYGVDGYSDFSAVASATAL